MVSWVSPDEATITAQFEEDVRFLMDGVKEQFGEITLGNGCYAATAGLALHANAGTIDPHEDGAGYTFGIVVIADDDHILRVAGQEWPLTPGTGFIINSDETHETVCRGSDCGLLAIITMDFFHDKVTDAADPRGYRLVPRQPTIPFHEFAQRATRVIADYIRDGREKFS